MVTGINKTDSFQEKPVLYVCTTFSKISDRFLDRSEKLSNTKKTIFYWIGVYIFQLSNIQMLDSKLLQLKTVMGRSENSTSKTGILTLIQRRQNADFQSEKLRNCYPYSTVNLHKCSLIFSFCLKNHRINCSLF